MMYTLIIKIIRQVSNSFRSTKNFIPVFWFGFWLQFISTSSCFFSCFLQPISLCQFQLYLGANLLKSVHNSEFKGNAVTLCSTCSCDQYGNSRELSFLGAAWQRGFLGFFWLYACLISQWQSLRSGVGHQCFLLSSDWQWADLCRIFVQQGSRNWSFIGSLGTPFCSTVCMVSQWGSRFHDSMFQREFLAGSFLWLRLSCSSCAFVSTCHHVILSNLPN